MKEKLEARLKKTQEHIDYAVKLSIELQGALAFLQNNPGAEALVNQVFGGFADDQTLRDRVRA